MWKIVALGITALASAIGLGTLGYSEYKKGKTLEEKLDESYNRIKGMTSVNISESLVNKVIKEEASKVASKMIEKAAKDATEEAAAYLHSKVDSEVFKYSDKIATKVAEAVDLDSLREKVEARAAKEVLKKYSDGVDDILNDLRKKSTEKPEYRYYIVEKDD